MSTAIATAEPQSPAITAQVVEQVMIKGDLKALSAEQKVQYYKSLCDASGLDARLNPFEYITLNGKEVLYAKKSCTDQLRNNRKINIQIVARDKVGDCFVVTARAMTPNGREDESIGAVSIGKATGDNLANALMKAETKAKRRVTLSICGLGILDETELETVPAYLSGNQARGDLKATLKAQPAAEQQQPAPRKMTPEEEAEWLSDFEAACSARSMSKQYANSVYDGVKNRDTFKAAYAKDPASAWEKLIQAVNDGKFDEKQAA